MKIKEKLITRNMPVYRAHYTRVNLHDKDFSEQVLEIRGRYTEAELVALVQKHEDMLAGNLAVNIHVEALPDEMWAISDADFVKHGHRVKDRPAKNE